MKMTFEIGKMPPLTDEQKRELEALDKMPDEQINYDEMPPITDEQFARSVLNPFYRRRNKVSVTMRVDAEVLDWLKRGGHGYQSRANSILRNAMIQELRH